MTKESAQLDLPDFFAADSDSSAETIQVVKDEKTMEYTSLFRIFKCIINNQKVNLSPSVAEHIVLNELSVNSSSCGKNLQAVLKDILIYLISAWPYWKRYIFNCAEILPEIECYVKFVNYLRYQIHYIMKNESHFDENTNADVKDKGTMTEQVTNKTPKHDSLFRLEVQGPPSVLNNLVFYESDNDVTINCLPSKDWTPISLIQLLNWPHCSVKVDLPDISFVRSNVHEYVRYLSLSGDFTSCPSVDYISYIKPVQENEPHSVYANNYFVEYFKAFQFTMREIYGPKLSVLNDLLLIFSEFSKDLHETNICNSTMATNTSVCFNIGRSTYIRNKKLVSSQKFSTNRAIIFSEIVIPKVDVTLYHFNVDQSKSATDRITFKNLDNLITKYRYAKNDFRYLTSETISYSCKFCNFTASGFDGKWKIMNHFELTHKPEQAVVCLKCKKETDICLLTSNRWQHVCTQ